MQLCALLCEVRFVDSPSWSYSAQFYNCIFEKVHSQDTSLSCFYQAIYISFVVFIFQRCAKGVRCSCNEGFTGSICEKELPPPTTPALTTQFIEAATFSSTKLSNSTLIAVGTVMTLSVVVVAAILFLLYRSVRALVIMIRFGLLIYSDGYKPFFNFF